MPKFRVTLKGEIPQGMIVEARDDTEARAEFCEDLMDWVEQVEMDCEEITEAGQ
jgi:hypothetical protein